MTWKLDILEVASMVVTWWIVAFLRSDVKIFIVNFVISVLMQLIPVGTPQPAATRHQAINVIIVQMDTLATLWILWATQCTRGCLMMHVMVRGNQKENQH